MPFQLNSKPKCTSSLLLLLEAHLNANIMPSHCPRPTLALSSTVAYVSHSSSPAFRSRSSFCPPASTLTLCRTRFLKADARPVARRRVRKIISTPDDYSPSPNPTSSSPSAFTMTAGYPPQSPSPVPELPEDYPLGPPLDPPRLAPRFWLHGLRDDILRRVPLYLSDWSDGFRFKSIPAILFLYFACLAPVVAFGGLTYSLTAGSIGVIEFIISSGLSGMIYALFSAQPLTFIAPTGLTLAFTAALFSFCKLYSLPFFPTYAWVGVWTAVILGVCAIINASDVIKYCTRFTDDIFNSLVATNFIYEASRSLIVPFFIVGSNKTNPFTGLALALGTFFLGRLFTALRTSRYLFSRARTFLADFGPILAISIMSFIASFPAVTRLGLDTLKIPSDFSLSGGRALLIPVFSAPMSVRLAAIVPAVLLSCLFFLDQNISTRVVNSSVPKLEKGPGYHLDIAVLAITTLAASVCGLPWMCAGTVQSLAHVQALSDIQPVNGEQRVQSVMENRLTAFAVHSALLGSLFLLPIVKRIPMTVISGLFLFLGTSMLSGSDLMKRIRYMFMDPKLYPKNTPMQKLPLAQVHGFTIVQVACLSVLWTLKLNKKTSMFFPAVIAMLMIIRSRIAPKFFSPIALATLDGNIASPEPIHNAPVEDGVGVPSSEVSSVN